MIQEIALKNEAREVDERSRPKTYEEYATAFQSTFDKVIGNQLQTLRGMSLDERAKRIREQYASRMVSHLVLNPTALCYIRLRPKNGRHRRGNFLL